MTDTPTIIQALVNAKRSIGAVGKGERNQQQQFLYRGVDAVVNACAPALIEQGIVVTPEVVEHSYETVEVGSKKTLMGHVIVAVKYTFWGPLGDSVSSTVVAESFDSGDKAAAKAMSVAYRIALLQTLSLPTDEPDPDSMSYSRNEDLPVQPKTARTVKKAEPEKKPLTLDELPGMISAATTIEDLRTVWKEAGAAGQLQSEVADLNGVKCTVQDLLYSRHDAISLRKSTESAA